MKINCSKCDSIVEVADTFTGNVISCPSCGGTSMLPMKGIAPGSEIAGYIIEKKLGAGGMGEVWKAKQKAMGRSVALKILPPALTQDPEFVKRFLGEVQMSAKLEHPNIVTAFDAGNDKSIYYLAMSYVEGYSLETRLEKEGAIPEPEALKIILGIVEALSYAWDEHKILHRDIKPANIMIDKRGNPKLMDMGISKSLSEDRALTMTGVAIGTPHYMSPEQARAEMDIDFRADLYSLGATLYQLVCGVVPYDATSMMAILTKHITDPFPWPRDRNPKVSEQCSTLLEIMMAKNKGDRQKSWEDLIKDINLVMQGKYPATKRPPRGQSIIISSVPSANNSTGPFSAVKNARFSNKTLYAAIAAGVILVGILAIFAVMMSSKNKNVPVPAKTQELVTREKEHAESVNTNEKVAPAKFAPVASAAQVDDDPTGKMIKAAIEELKKKNLAQKDWRVEYRKEGNAWRLYLSDNPELTDISPLKGLQLTSLILSNTRVSDISFLKGMALRLIGLDGTLVSDISILKGMPLTQLSLNNTRVSDINALKDMPLNILWLSSSNVSDISVLKGMHLNTLSIQSTKVSDITALKGMPVETLVLDGCKNLADISALVECRQLKKLSIPEQCKDIGFLKSFPCLEILDNKIGATSSKRTPAEFWKDWDTANGKVAASIPIASGGEYLVIDLSTCELTYSGPVPADLLTNGSYKADKLVMRRIPTGTFMMGETGKQHKVTLTKDFYIGVFNVTQEQYEKVMKANPSGFKDAGKDAPVDTVSWDDCQIFIKELNGKSSVLAFRLPTEAEWEYACRGGQNSKGFEYSGSNTPAEVGWFKEDSGGKTHPVGKKKPNELGLYDMSGNIFEWCADWYGDYPKELEKDPQGPKSGSKRILRGCCWSNDVVGGGRSRLSVRGQIVPSGRSKELGFRLALSSP